MDGFLSDKEFFMKKLEETIKIKLQYGGSVFGEQPDWSEAYKLQPDYNWIINPTAQIVKVNDRGGIEDRFCTGFLIDKRHFITAGHCTPALCDMFNTKPNLQVVFNYQLASESKEQKERPYQINRILESRECKVSKVDYAIFEMASDSAYNAFGTIGLSSEAQVGNNIVLAHHPDGQRKKVSFGKLLAKNGLFKHDADTLGGSSGAPFGREASCTAVGIHIQGASNSKDHNKAVPISDVAAASAIVSRLTPS